MKNAYGPLMEKLYKHLAQGDFAGFLSGCHPSLSFQIPGKSALAGKYTQATFGPGLAMKMRELSGGTYQLEVHDVLASDLHATLLGTATLTRHGKKTEYRTVHVWRFEDGKPVAGYEYPRDLYAYDEAWKA